MKHNIKGFRLEGRITENVSDIQDVVFIEQKLNQGLDDSTIIRQAVNVWRKYESGELFQEKLKVMLQEILAQGYRIEIPAGHAEKPNLEIRQPEFIPEQHTDPVVQRELSATAEPKLSDTKYVNPLDENEMAQLLEALQKPLSFKTG